MIGISFAYTDRMGELHLKQFTVTGVDDALRQIHEYLFYDIRAMVKYKCDVSSALWGRGDYFHHRLQVMIHDMLNYHKEKI